MEKLSDAEVRRIDGGDRSIARTEASSFDAAMNALDELLDLCPPDSYPMRAVIQKSSHGARVSVKIVYQTRGRPLESVASRQKRYEKSA